MKKVLSILLALAMVAALIPAVFAVGDGSYDDPIIVTETPATITVPAEDSVYISVDATSSAMILTVNGGQTFNYGWTLQVTKLESYSPDKQGKCEVTLEAGIEHTLVILNGNETAIELEVSTVAVGSGEGDNVVKSGEANFPTSEDYETFYWTAPADGELTITVKDANPGWYLMVDYDFTKFSGGSEESTNTYAVTAGITYGFEIGGLDAYGNYAAATFTYSIIFTPAASGDDNVVKSGEANFPTSEDYETFYWTAPADGELTITVKDANPGWYLMVDYDFTKFSGGSEESTNTYAVTAGITYGFEIGGLDAYGNYAAATFTYSIIFTPTSSGSGSGSGSSSGSGTMDDPAALVIGENVAPVPAGMDYYYYSWTATDNGTLTITMTGADYYWKVDNMTAGKYGSAHSGGENTETISVSTGDLVYVCVSTDSGNGGNIPFTAEFTPDSGSGSGSSYEDFGTTVYLVTIIDPFTKAEDPEIHKDTITATGAGTITVTIAGDPGYRFSLFYPGYPDGGSETHVGAEKYSHKIEVTEAGVYTIEIASYANWGFTSGKVSYELSFTPGDVESDKPAYIIKDDVITKPGTYNITMEYADVTIVTFTPDETGIYQITAVSNGVIGNYGGSSAYIFPSESVEHGVTLQWTCQQVGYWTTTDIQDENFEWITIDQYIPGQSLMLGIKPVSEDVTSVQIVIEKIGDYTPEDVPTVIYENKADLKDFKVPAGATLGDYVNVYDEQTHTAVPGTDGYFHLDSADGPILLVDLDYLYHLADALGEGRGTMFVNGTDENGNPVRFDIGAACKAYDYVSDENGYYPLTIDLMFFYKDYGAAQGVYSWALNEDPQNPGYNPDSAWMFACLTMTLPEDESSKTGESFPMGAIIAALALSAAACAAVVTNKKRFF